MSLSDGATEEQDDRLLEAVEFARGRLGPESERLLREPSQQALLARRLSQGQFLEDAVLAQVFTFLKDRQALQNEFFSYILATGHAQFSGLLPAGLRRFLETGDLVQSVFGDLLGDLQSLWFETRSQFLALLLQRLRWKAADHDKQRKAQRRQEQLRVSTSPETLQQSDQGPSPASKADDREREERLVLALMRLGTRDREIIKMHLRGEPVERIGESLGLEREAARKALRRALHRARALL